MCTHPSPHEPLPQWTHSLVYGHTGTRARESFSHEPTHATIVNCNSQADKHTAVRSTHTPPSRSCTRVRRANRACSRRTMRRYAPRAPHPRCSSADREAAPAPAPAAATASDDRTAAEHHGLRGWWAWGPARPGGSVHAPPAVGGAAVALDLVAAEGELVVVLRDAPCLAGAGAQAMFGVIKNGRW